MDQDGIEGTAATVISAEPVGARVTQHRLRIDRPFLYVVHDVALALPLLVGGITDPC